MTLPTLRARLIAEGTIERVRVNRYKINRTPRSMGLPGVLNFDREFTRQEIDDIFFEQFSGGWRFRPIDRSRITIPSAPTSTPERERPVVLRTINRCAYHSSGSGTSRTGVASALRAIPIDADGVRRSFGLEYEVYSLSREQEDKLARLLDTLPAHVTERDGSLGDDGVEIVFMPMGAEQLKTTWNALSAFVRENNVRMSRDSYGNGAGAHITYGVSNSEVTVSDLQIRINRIALAVKAASTQGAIKRVFGRDFVDYARLPNSTTTSNHSNAWSASRGNSAYELRLCQWKGDIDKIIDFMKATEFVFHRTFTAQDFINIFTIMGSDCSGE